MRSRTQNGFLVVERTYQDKGGIRMAEKMKQNIILKILDAVRKTAVKGAYSPSLKGMFEKEVPGKLRGGWKSKE